jgi:hypothetical protein
MLPGSNLLVQETKRMLLSLIGKKKLGLNLRR